MARERIPLIAGNWKMNSLRADGVALARAIAAGPTAGCELLVCPPGILVPPVAEALAESGVAVGGQDCHSEPKGAHTGDLSAEMLADAGCRYVILGHSERRADHGESDALVKSKIEAAWRGGLIAILCVGETLDEREAGRALSVITTQLEGSLPGAATAANTVIAYEPVWAIGTGRTPTLQDVADVHSHIRDHLRSERGEAMAEATRILYGGSMKPENAGDLLAIDGVDGGLIGGASLKAGDFLAIAGSCR